MSINYEYLDDIFINYIKDMDDRNLKLTRKLKIESIEKGIIYPKNIGESEGGVTDKNNNFIEISKLNAFLKEDSFGGSENSGKINKKYSDFKVVYIGNFWKQWGHFLIDSISRIWYFLENDSEKFKICYTGEKIDGIYKDFFNLFGLDESRFINIQEPHQFKEVIVPECSHMPGLYYSKEWLQIFDKVIDKAMKEYTQLGLKNHGKRIIFSRKNFIKKFKAPFEIGELKIVKLFQKNGYEVIYPEEYSLIEQISIIQNSDEIVSISGTLAHTLIFAKNGTKLIQLKKYVESNYRQIEINQARNLQVYNIDVHISPFIVTNGGPFVFDLNENIITFFKLNSYEISKIEIVKSWFLRKIYLIYYVFVYVVFVKIIQRKVQEPVISFMRDLDDDSKTKLKREMKKFYLKKFFH